MIIKWRQEIGEPNVRPLLDAYQWIDPGQFLPRAAPAAIFIQAAKLDSVAGGEYARRYYALASQPKKIEIYDAPHALNAAARRDRASWLQKQLKLGKVDRNSLSQAPAIE